MKNLLLLMGFFFLLLPFSFAQNQGASPCTTNPIYRAFDFWIGEWEVYGARGKAGESRIELILDSCIIIENWIGENRGYAGKSFNTYNAATNQWQQTWVDNKGGSIEFLRGNAAENKITFWADNIKGKNGKVYGRRLSFYKLNADKVRQHGEKSDDGGITWTTEYDLEYRRKM